MDNWIKAQIDLHREESHGTQHMGSFTVSHTPKIKNIKELEAAITNAVTDWMNTTPEGASAWKYASSDFNYGDMLSGMCPPTEIQKKYGFVILREKGTRSYK